MLTLLAAAPPPDLGASITQFVTAVSALIAAGAALFAAVRGWYTAIRGRAQDVKLAEIGAKVDATHAMTAEHLEIARSAAPAPLRPFDRGA